MTRSQALVDAPRSETSSPGFEDIDALVEQVNGRLRDEEKSLLELVLACRPPWLFGSLFDEGADDVKLLITLIAKLDRPSDERVLRAISDLLRAQTKPVHASHDQSLMIETLDLALDLLAQL